jgi:hypothetical protein
MTIPVRRICSDAEEQAIPHGFGQGEGVEWMTVLVLLGNGTAQHRHRPSPSSQHEKLEGEVAPYDPGDLNNREG